MSYNEYLFCCLLKLYDKTFEELEYDLQYKLGMKQYKHFQSTDFNDISIDLYQCIINYLEDKYGKRI
jgi:hypothetical protein